MRHIWRAGTSVRTVAREAAGAGRRARSWHAPGRRLAGRDEPHAFPSHVLLLARDRSRSRLDELCEFAPSERTTPEELVLWFVQLVAWLRPSRSTAATRRYASSRPS